MDYPTLSNKEQIINFVYPFLLMTEPSAFSRNTLSRKQVKGSFSIHPDVSSGTMATARSKPPLRRNVSPGLDASRRSVEERLMTIEDNQAEINKKLDKILQGMLETSEKNIAMFHCLNLSGTSLADASHSKSPSHTHEDQERPTVEDLPNITGAVHESTYLRTPSQVGEGFSNFSDEEEEEAMFATAGKPTASVERKDKTTSVLLASDAWMINPKNQYAITSSITHGLLHLIFAGFEQVSSLLGSWCGDAVAFLRGCGDAISHRLRNPSASLQLIVLVRVLL
jgi:hypothetical protein